MDTLKKDQSDEALRPKSGKPDEDNGAAKGASGELGDDQLENVAGGVRAMKWDGF